MSGRISLVCFDLGGVLVRICRSWEEGCAAAGIELRTDAPGAGSSDHHAAQRLALVHALDMGRVEPTAFYQAISMGTRGLYTVQEVRRIHGAWLLGEYDGAAALVERLNATPGVETACLSNTNVDHWEALLRYPALQSLRHRHASYIMGLRKPDEACFRAFERAVGRRADEILFFDDLIENVEAAKRFGWRAEQIDHTSDTSTQIRLHLQSHGVFR